MEKERVIIVTGAGGFVGSRFITYNRSKYNIIPLSLREKKLDHISWENIDAVVHLAGKAHEMKPIPDEIYYEINYDLTKELALHARAQKVPHFIYISSTKVYGDVINHTLNENSACHPTDPYGKSKRQAEEFLLGIASDDFKVAIIRPPLVYGPQVKGNMIKLLKLSDSGFPLPFGNMNNHRSMVFVDNLIELINTIIRQQAHGVFVAGDLQPVSTGFLVSTMRKDLHKARNLLAVPGVLKKLIKKIRPALYERLYGSFVVNNEQTNQQLSFTPPYTTEQGIKEMVDWYKEKAHS